MKSKKKKVALTSRLMPGAIYDQRETMTDALNLAAVSGDGLPLCLHLRLRTSKTAIVEKCKGAKN